MPRWSTRRWLHAVADVPQLLGGAFRVRPDCGAHACSWLEQPPVDGDVCRLKAGGRFDVRHDSSAQRAAAFHRQGHDEVVAVQLDAREGDLVTIAREERVRTRRATTERIPPVGTRSIRWNRNATHLLVRKLPGKRGRWETTG